MKNFEKGRVYKCPVCGAETTVIKPKSDDLELHCCNTFMKIQPRINKSFKCKTCKSEIMVIRNDDANLDPHCCNEIMESLLCLLKA